MCGVVAIVGVSDSRERLHRALDALRHRGPDAQGQWHDDACGASLGHARLSIIDLSEAGRQPMTTADGRFVIVFNGEVYNYLELRAELADYPFRSQTDSEVVLAAWSRWGAACLDRLIGMFAFAIWDTEQRELVCVRDRFGVKPLFVANLAGGGFAVASEIKSLRRLGVATDLDAVSWATYLTTGYSDHTSRTFWTGIESVPAGSILRRNAQGSVKCSRWYDLAERVGDALDARSDDAVKDEYRALVEDSVRLRFRSDVPVGICVSGGLDSSTLLGLVHAVQGQDSDIKVFTFVTGDSNYDELPWVEEMLAHTRHPLFPCALSASEVPALFERIARAEDEPFGGIPTLAYSRVFERARAEGVIVLMDGQGVDEQWAGYDYYRRGGTTTNAPVVQGSVDSPLRADCLSADLAQRAEPLRAPERFGDRIRDLQLRDTLFTKLPRALRFNDRVSMASSTELREPFLDHRLFELALRQPTERKIRGDSGKWLVRELTADLLPNQVRLAPKRPVQTPQREWLREPLREWANELIESAFHSCREWFDVPAARTAWQRYQQGQGDNSFWVWQWLSLGFLAQRTGS
jgi:asparagine synthase (glutamine-hydrolysing)